MTDPTPISDSAPESIEIIYSEVDGVSITMDVYILEKATKGKPILVLLWWHGMQTLPGTCQQLLMLLKVEVFYRYESFLQFLIQFNLMNVLWTENT